MSSARDPLPPGSTGEDRTPEPAPDRPHAERYFQAVFEASLDAVLIVDDQGRYTEVNGAACELFGLSREALIGRHIAEFAAPGFDVEAAWVAFQRDGRGRGEFPLLRADGEVRDVEWGAIRDFVPGRHLSVCRDVTESRRSQRELVQRMDQLLQINDLTAAVNRATDLETIYSEAMRGLQRSLDADRAAVLRYDPDGVMRFKSWIGLPEDYRRAAEGHSPWTRADPDPRPVLVADVARDPDLSPALKEFILAEGIQALGFIPLLSQGKLLGKLMIYYNQPHPFSAPDVQLAETVASHIAFAIERKASEEESREAEKHRRMQFEVTRVLAESVSLEEATPQLLRAFCDTLEWEIGAIWSLDRTNNVMRCVDIWHSEAGEAPEFEAFSRSSVFSRGIGMPGRVWVTGEPAWISDVTADPNFPRSVVARKDGIHAGCGFPILIRGEVAGVLEFFSRRVREPDQQLMRILEDLGIRIGQFIERRVGEEWLRFLAEAKSVLAASLDYRTTLGRTASLAVPRLADWCVVDVLDEDGMIRRVAAAHRDPTLAARAMSSVPPIPADTPGEAVGVVRALRTGRSELVSGITDAFVDALARSSEHRELLREIGLVSMMIVPLSYGGRTFGAITYSSTDPDRRFGPSELQIAEQLASRAALAVENARLFQQAQEASRQKTRFLSAVSHDLRTPVNAILLHAYLARVEAEKKDGPPDAAVLRDHCRRLELAAQGFADLLTNLLEISSFESGQKTMRDEVFRLSEVLTEAVETLRSQAEAKGLTVTLSTRDGNCGVRADRTELLRVVMNLLANAVKFTDSGSVAVESARTEGGGVAILVRDTGTGIPAEHLPSLFSEFFQVRNPERDRTKGTGLGLAISRRIMEAFGGTLQAESRVGKGSVFTATLPAERVLASSPKTRTRDTPSPAKKRASGEILIVEDDESSRIALAQILKTEGYQVRTAGGGEEALSALASDPADLVLLDMMMPGMDGTEVLRRIRDAAGPGGTRVIVLTGDVTRERLHKIQEQRPDGFLGKPVQVAALLESVRAALRRA